MRVLSTPQCTGWCQPTHQGAKARTPWDEAGDIKPAWTWKGAGPLPGLPGTLPCVHQGTWLWAGGKAQVSRDPGSNLGSCEIMDLRFHSGK